MKTSMKRHGLTAVFSAIAALGFVACAAIANGGGFGPAQGGATGAGGVVAASNISGQVSVPNGGTSLATLTAHAVLLGEGTSALGAVAPVASGSALFSTGVSSDPAMVALGIALDMVGGSAPGTTLVRSTATSGWHGVVAGTNAYVWTSNGPNVEPTWQAAAGGGAASSVAATDGTKGSPSISFGNNTDIGLYNDTNIDGVSISSGNSWFGTVNSGVSGGGGTLQMSSTSSLSWGTTNATGTSVIDTDLSRGAAGEVDFGTGANGSKAGSWKASNGSLSGGLTVTGAGPHILAAGSDTMLIQNTGSGDLNIQDDSGRIGLRSNGSNLYVQDGTCSFVANAGHVLNLGGDNKNAIQCYSSAGAPTVWFFGLVHGFNNILTAGYGIPAIYASQSLAAQTASDASLVTFTPAADGSFLISPSITITSTAVGLSMSVAYKNQNGVSQNQTLAFLNAAGSVVNTLTTIGTYEGVSVRIRAQAGTAIVVSTAITSGTYDEECDIQQVK